MSLLGVDIGTTGCKAAAFSADGVCVAQAYREYAIHHPSPGWAELDSRAVWRNIRDVLREVGAGTRHDPITALCASSLAEAGVLVTHARDILGNSILFSATRGGEYIEALLRTFSREAFYDINRNLPGPHYSLPKLLWLREHQPAVYRQADRFLLWADALGFFLGGEPTACHSLASRTLLFDLRREDWSEELLAWSGIERGKLGRIVPAGTVTGTVADAVAAELGLPTGIQIVAGGHDQCCNALGAGIITPGRAVCGLGTFECITPVYRGIPDARGLLANGLNLEHHLLPGLYVSFLYNQAGTLVRWFRDTFARGEQVPARADVYDRLAAEMPAEPTRLLVLPYFEPSGPPGFVSDAAGAVLGLRTTTTRGEILKAIMECVTLYFADSLASLRDLGIDTGEFVATGGGAKSDAWLQIQADIFGVPIIRPRITEASVLGAALLAGLATGVFADAAEGVGRFVKPDRVFTPDPRRHAIYRAKLAHYRQLLPALHPLLRRL